MDSSHVVGALIIGKYLKRRKLKVLQKKFKAGEHLTTEELEKLD